MIEIEGVTRRFGGHVALDDVTFTVPDGAVTGFVGPNGAGKSTALHVITGLDGDATGTVRIDGVVQRQGEPRSGVGALLDASWAHPRRSARDHLRALSLVQGVPEGRVAEVLELTGLGGVARRRVGQFSLGMRQRLGIAGALLAEPKNVILDEPVNGLDPDGIAWVRQLARSLAAGGAAVLMSSHLLAELAQTADRIVVIGQGRILGSGPIGDFVQTNTDMTRVTSLDDELLAEALQRAGWQVERQPVGLRVAAPAAAVGRAALGAGVCLTNLQPEAVSLEDRFRELTADQIEYRAEGLVTA
ncbi:ATP-binding cassette domain-containing protein [Tessaracoccus sp. OH4464_COT-324]|uniref:ATP-binding cassette domain-containing protein n=1 Tax=Tessaracoccus sp. OH4464_COT-324 TaxID=2491059 RepID=UPI000F632D49|nr:ATP-binding cassette domain-containing protein [Tessaracoccus sp. OH4464_COT-324]RRD47333.1 ATP-binding cassette domain-containing protein [Tessaracoccus sp. OH4464_COT-324]